MNPLADPASSSTDALFRTGNQILDDQHLQILRNIRSLIQSMGGPFPLDTLEARLSQIEALAFDHFRDEEGLMELSRYPNLPVHRAEHELIVERYHDMAIRYAEPGSKPLTTMLEECLEIFDYHIQKIDMDFVNYLKDPAR
jgi:hemerythrin-like metal-binding protein